jgi:signal transduction histidine kinase
VAIDVDLDDFLEDVVMRWSEVAPRAWRVGRLAGGRLQADPERLRIALDALIENAVQHTAPAAVIEVRSRQAGSNVVIEVADSGEGIPPHAVNRIFERFGRAENGHGHDSGGLGLGLAIVNAIAQSNGGRCTVTSSAEGSVFALSLPRFRPPAPERDVELPAPADVPLVVPAPVGEG